MNNDYTARWLLYKGLRQYVGHAINLTIYREKHKFLKVGGTRCQRCSIKLRYKDRTIDHIIPKETCKELELYGLLFDHRNFQVTCERCNAKKSGSLAHLPESVLVQLENRRALLQNI